MYLAISVYIMELLGDVCRLCLTVSPGNMENLFENKEIWTKISSTLKVKLQQQLCLPNGICYACKALTDHIYSFYLKVIKSQTILNKKFHEGANGLQDFFYTLKNIKSENVGDFDVDNINESITTDEIYDYVSNEDDLSAKTSYNTVSVKSETDIEIQNRREDLRSLRNNQNVTDNRKNCFDNVIKNEGDLDEDFAQESDSDVSGWKPQTKSKRKLKLHKGAKRFAQNKNISECNELNKPSKLSKMKKVEGVVANPEKPEEAKNAEIIDIENDMQEPKEDHRNCKCLTCFQILPSRKLLAAHFASKHTPEIAVSHDINLENYTKLKENNKILCKCGYCGKLYKTKNIKEHILIVHNKIRPYVCNICGKTFKRINAIITHNRAHNGLSLFCSYHCGYSTAYSSALRKHEMGKHRGVFRYTCECGKGFDAKTWYEDHQNEHKGIKPYVCPVCQQAYHYEKQLKAHSRRAHLKTDGEINKEIRLLCTLCSHPCDDMPALKDHLFKKHGIKREYLCDICGRSCNSSSHLHSHKREMHSDEKPFSCSQCDKSFKSRPKLRRHQRSHTNERPYSCPHCPKHYARPQGLKHHLLTCKSTKTEDRTEAMEAL